METHTLTVILLVYYYYYCYYYYCFYILERYLICVFVFLHFVIFTVKPRSVSGVEMRKRQAAHIEAPPQAPGQPQPNTCCLCWCGCCKCLW